MYTVPHYFSTVFMSGGLGFEHRGPYSFIAPNLKPIISQCTGNLKQRDDIHRALQHIIKSRATLARLTTCQSICLAHFLPLPPAVT